MRSSIRLGSPLLLTALLGACPALADEPQPDAAAVKPATVKLTLAQCLARLDANHPLIGAAADDVRKAVAERDAMSGKGWPTVNVNMSAGPAPKNVYRCDSDATGNPTNCGWKAPLANDYMSELTNLTVFYRTDLTIIQPLYTFGKLDAATRGLTEAVEMQRSKGEQARWDVVTQVRTLYYGWLLLRHMDDVLADVQGTVRDARKYIDEQLDSKDSEVSDLDRLRIDSYGHDVDNQRLDVDKRLAQLKDGLTRLLQLDLDAPWEPADERLEPLPAPAIPLATLYDTAVGHQPELQAGLHGVRALEGKLAAYHSRYYPDLYAAGGLGYAVAPGRQKLTEPGLSEPFNYFNFGVYLGLRWSWDVGVLGHETEQVEAEVAAARKRVVALEQRVRHDVFAAYTDLDSSRRQVDTAEEAYRTARTWAAMANERFEMGTATARDLVDGLVAFIKARYTYLQAALDYNLTIAKLSSVVGEELQAGLVQPTP